MLNVPFMRKERILPRDSESQREHVGTCNLDNHSCENGLPRVRGKPVTQSIVVEVSTSLSCMLRDLFLRYKVSRFAILYNANG